MLPLTRSRNRTRFFGKSWDPFAQSGPTLDLTFAGVPTDPLGVSSLTDYTLNANFIGPQYQIAAQYVVWETNVGLVDKTFSQIITFTRASTATYFDSAGVLQSAAIDTPRFDYDPATLAARGFLIEEARTNLLLQSEDFANSAGPVLWIWPAGVVTGNTEVAPDGTTTADTVTSSGGAQSVYQNITVTASTAYTFSVFVKLGTMSAANYKIAFYDNIAATFIASDIVPAQVPNNSGWTRISYTFTTPVGCTSVRVYPFRNSALIPSSTVFIWGAQLE